MALINCPECDGTVSSKASACPHCGWIIKNDPYSQNPPPEFPSRIAHQEPPTTGNKSAVTATAATPDSKTSGWAHAVGAAVVFLVILVLNKAFPDLKLLDSLPFGRERIQREQAEESRRVMVEELARKVLLESQEKTPQLRQDR